VLRLRAATALVALIAVLLPAGARANGDPASDVLISAPLYVPSAAPSGEQVTKLRGVIARARSARLPVRVAIIDSSRDLGAVSNLFGHPREYAELLRGELVDPAEPGAKSSKEPLLVVMPAGFGTGNVPPDVDRKLRGIEVPADASPDALVGAAGYGVQEYAKARGRPIPATFDKPEASGGGGALVPLLIVLGLGALAAVLIVIRIRARAETDT